MVLIKPYVITSYSIHYTKLYENGIIHNLRVGTAEIESLLKEYYPNKNIKRFDRDEIKTDKKLKEVLNEFNSNKIDILIGSYNFV